MDGSESELLPQWVKEAVLHSSYTTPPELKCAFILLPKDVRFAILHSSLA